jgi:ABC-type Mn2+/Zn2+ transport system permease subunit
MTFFESSFLWLDVVLAASISAAAVAAVGVHAVLRRVVFLPAALSQVAGLGVVLTFLIAHRLPALEPLLADDPGTFAAVFAAGVALLLGFVRESRGSTREWLLGAVFVLASALVLLLGGLVSAEMHDVSDVLFGNAIALEHGPMVRAVTTSAAVLALNALLARPFVGVAFDPDTARAHGAPVRLLDALLYLSLGLAIAANTRVVGALPSFAFSVFPAAGALRLARDPLRVVLLAAVTGAAAAFLGYWASFELSLPTGACMATVAALLYGLERAVGVRSNRP